MHRIRIVKGDLTRENVDAIVNAANSALRGGGGVDGAVHRAAGPGLLAECVERYPNGCATGQARITTGHDLPARHVIHTVGPVWQGGAAGEPGLLASCYRSVIAIAEEHGLTSLSFPAISCGIYGYPWPEAAKIALSEMARESHIEDLRIVLFSNDIHKVFTTVLEELQSD
ncbi:MAG: O-acetyl-ADP-ribose deacetylase [Planctomycetes bacterium]|jgi:O-acetyl-ADP-ribose deacetylase (regulator of RNase III)|nr:O-acetyl-ADP-ribose deacetylase [Planctomycetota bacterium]